MTVLNKNCTVLQGYSGLHISLGTQHDTAPLHHSYLSTLQWAVDTADLDVAMFGPGDDLQSLKVTAQNHHITTWCVGLSRHKEIARMGERWRWHSNPPRENCMNGHLNCTCLGDNITASNMPPYDSSGLWTDMIRILCAISVALRSRSSHEQWFTVTVSPSQEDRTEIVILLIHSLNSMRILSHRVCFEITEWKKAVRDTASVFQTCGTVLKPKQGPPALEGSAFALLSMI